MPTMSAKDMTAGGVLRAVAVGLGLVIGMVRGVPPQPLGTAVGMLVLSAWQLLLATRVWRRGRQAWFADVLLCGEVAFMYEGLLAAMGHRLVKLPWLGLPPPIVLFAGSGFCIRREARARPENWRAIGERFSRASPLDLLLGQHPGSSGSIGCWAEDFGASDRLPLRTLREDPLRSCP